MKRFLSVLIFVFALQTVSGQSPSFQSYFLLRKNEPVKINKIVQDKTGFIWFATDKGLFKFDGVTYRRFLGIDNLPDENVTALAVDSVGRLWAGFKNGKISIIEKNKITPFEPEEGLSKEPVSDILFDHHGVLWFSTFKDGIYYFFNNRLYRLDDMDGMPDLFAYDLEVDANGDVWCGTDGGAAICQRKGNAVEIKVINYSSGLPDNIVKKILKGGANSVWLATEDAGLVSYDFKTQKVSPLMTSKWNNGSINDIALVDDWMWIGTSQGLVSVDLSENTRMLKSQSSDQTTALFSDAEGSLWIGSKAGVQRTLGQRLQFLVPDEDENVVAVTVDQRGAIWYSTAQGLFKRHLIDGKIVTEKPLAGSAYSGKSVISLFTDAAGFVWAGLYGEGALRLHPQTNALRTFSKELRNGSVLNISGKDKSVWLSTLGGATAISTDNLTVKNYSTVDGLATDYIYQVFVDSQDRVWFATDRDGVDMLDANGFHHFKENLNSKVVYGFAEDSLHRVWTNVQNAGLFLFDGKNFVPFESQIRLHNLNANIFSSGNNGQLLTAHELGIDVFNPIKNKFQFYDDQTGIGNRIANLNAVAHDNKNGIFLGTDHGLVVYHEHGTKRQDSPNAHIDVFEADDQIIDLQKSDQLKYDQNNIKIGFIGFWYQDPRNLTFAYQLDNYDRDWIVTHDNSATYSKLPPGEYTFKLKVSASNDFSNARETKIHFVVTPPFWRTSWFYFLLVAVIGFLTYSFIRYRERQLLRDKYALEVKVRERTEEIEMKTHEIQAQAEEIRGINENLESLVRERTIELERKNKAIEDYAFINAHELRAPVASILGLINLMQRLKLDDDEKILLEHLQQSAKKLDSVVSSITEAIERGDYTTPAA